MYKIVRHGNNATLGQIQHALRNRGYEISLLVQPHEEFVKNWDQPEWVGFLVDAATPTFRTRTLDTSPVLLMTLTTNRWRFREGQLDILYEVLERQGVGIFTKF